MSGTPAKVQHKVSFHDDLDDLEESQSKPKLQQKVSFHAGLEEDSNDREDLSSPASSPSATSPCHEEEDNVSDESAEEAPIKKKRSLRSTNTAGSIASGPGPPRLYKPPTWMRRLLTSKLFLSTNALIILLNMVWTGFLANSYVDIEVNEHADGTAFFVIESLFTGVFLAELIIRMIYFASIRFWHDLWLCFDLVVIGCPAVEIWILRPLGWNEGTFTITVMNIFRVFRVGRGVAALANIKWFRPMYLAAVGFKHSMNSLMVVFIYLASLTFTVAVVLCHLLGPSNPKFSDLPELVRGRFRSVERSVLSVIECLLGGIEWGPDLVDLLLFNQEWSMWGEDTVFAGRALAARGMVLLTFLVLGSLLWLNTVSGIFMQQVDRSFELTNMTQFGDKEYQAATRELLREFMEDLYEMDHDGTQSLSWREISLVVTHHMEVLSDLGIRTLNWTAVRKWRNGRNVFVKTRRETIFVFIFNIVYD
ncbi:unnamed protein product [Durusdinium trenchii]|uniref:Ion transport domain-containing protein n=1 Tax=Durusdinium trenchii TaxID=1381693 RepID=A0ABP0PD68_9DINO